MNNHDNTPEPSDPSAIPFQQELPRILNSGAKINKLTPAEREKLDERLKASVPYSKVCDWLNERHEDLHFTPGDISYYSQANWQLSNKISHPRRGSTFARIPPPIRAELDIRLLNKVYTLDEIVEWLRAQGYVVTIRALQKYSKLHAVPNARRRRMLSELEQTSASVDQLSTCARSQAMRSLVARVRSKDATTKDMVDIIAAANKVDANARAERRLHIQEEQVSAALRAEEERLAEEKRRAEEERQAEEARNQPPTLEELSARFDRFFHVTPVARVTPAAPEPPEP